MFGTSWANSTSSSRRRYGCLTIDFQVDRIRLAFAPTERNGPLRSFLAEFVPPEEAADAGITERAFRER